MHWLLTLSAGALTLGAALGVAVFTSSPIEERPDEAAAVLRIDAADVDRKHVAWDGDAERRDDIIVSAVWGEDSGYRPPKP